MKFEESSEKEAQELIQKLVPEISKPSSLPGQKFLQTSFFMNIVLSSLPDLILILSQTDAKVIIEEITEQIAEVAFLSPQNLLILEVTTITFVESLKHL